MPSTYTPGGIELIGDGEQSGNWGGTTNTNLQILDRMISQAGTITLSGTTHTLTISDGTLSDGQYGVLVFGGSPSGTNTVTISPNDAQRSYIVKNGSGQSVVLTQGSGGNVTVADGKTALVYCDGAGSGAAVVDLTADLAVTALTLADLGVTASASELNTLDGITATTAELNILDGVTADATELNILDGVTATTAELNILDGVTATTAELNLLDGITALSGSDTEIVTGTAGTDGQIGKWNADGDLIGVGTNTANGDVVVLEDVGGSPGLPAVDGSQLTGISAGAPAWTESSVVATTSGTAFDETSLPSGLTEIEIHLSHTLSAGDSFLVQIGTGGSPTTSGYRSSSTALFASNNFSGSTAGFFVNSAGSGAINSAKLHIHKEPGTNKWHAYITGSQASYSVVGSGELTLAGVLDNFRITRTGATTFTSGSYWYRYR